MTTVINGSYDESISVFNLGSVHLIYDIITPQKQHNNSEITTLSEDIYMAGFTV